MVRSGKADLRLEGIGTLVFGSMIECIRNLTSKLNRTTFAAMQQRIAVLQRRTNDGPDRRREP
jgi:hypothetical protein